MDSVEGRPEQYVIARSARGPGLGTRLISLAGAVWLAKQLERPVVVDWRSSAYLEDASLNYFTEFFEPVPEILGVPILYAPSAEAGDHREAPEGERVRLRASQCRKLLAERGTVARYLVTGGVLTLEDLDPRGDAASHDRFLKAFYGHIAPREHIAGELEAWSQEHLRDRFVVGVNVSTGNGSFGEGKKKGAGRVDVRVFERERRFLRKIETACERATRRLPKSIRDRYKIFFATDSSPMAELLGRLPRAVTRRTIFPPPGVGRRFSQYEQVGYTDRAAAEDTIIDMLLLARCQALVRNESMFSYYALVSTDYFEGNVYDHDGRTYDLESLRLKVRGKGRVLTAGSPARRTVGRVERLMR
jgi:hypothetical protein